MEKDTKPVLENELQKMYWEYIYKRTQEYTMNSLTGRLVIDFQKGMINSVQDQAIIAGASAMNFYDQKILTSL